MLFFLHPAFVGLRVDITATIYGLSLYRMRPDSIVKQLAEAGRTDSDAITVADLDKKEIEIL
jgi:hypothetical protein